MQVCKNPLCKKPYRTVDFLGTPKEIPDCDCNRLRTSESDNDDSGKLYKKSYLKSQLPMMYFDRNFNNIESVNNLMIDFVKSWLVHEPFKSSMFIKADKSTGKSLMSAIAGSTLIKKGKLVYYTKPSRIYNKIFDKSQNSSQFIEHLQNVDILILDDVTKGINKDGEWHKWVMYDIIDFRYENNKQIIFNAKESQEEVARALGDDTFDRIFEMCDHGKWFKSFNGLKNYRMSTTPA